MPRGAGLAQQRLAPRVDDRVDEQQRRHVALELMHAAVGFTAGHCRFTS